MRTRSERLERLKAHFPELPTACGNSTEPGVIDTPDYRDWSREGTSPDQGRIEEWMDRFDLRRKTVLHIGIGSSQLAIRRNSRVGRIVGTSIAPQEIAVATALNLPNYTAILHNKYSGVDLPGKATFDFVVDNNPTSMCCCLDHFAQLLEFYADHLSPDGQVVTDSEGLGWVNEDSFHPRWSFDFADLAAAAEPFGLKAYRRTRTIYVLSRSDPPQPSLRSRLAHAARRLRRVPRRIPHHMRRLIVAS
jgi:SAM-dependent methyltransferase